jgi:putative aminopeptidase FrvX
MPYDPAYADQARHLCHLGATDHEIAEYFGVSVGTLNRWRFAHREFAEALVVGGELADARIACGLMMTIVERLSKRESRCQFSNYGSSEDACRTPA